MENDESIAFDTENIGIMDMVKSNIYPVDFKRKIISGKISVKQIFIKIFAKTNTVSSYTDENFMENRPLSFDRLRKYDDIVVIKIEFNNNTNNSIYASWCEDNDENNLYQTSMVDEVNGDL